MTAAPRYVPPALRLHFGRKLAADLDRGGYDGSCRDRPASPTKLLPQCRSLRTRDGLSRDTLEEVSY